MSEKTQRFINTIGVLARNEFLSRPQWILPSVAIAQGALESGWNLEARSLFGIKGFGFVSTTSEYYNDHYEDIQASFREYPNIASAVVGYYDFLRDTPRYANALNNDSYIEATKALIYTLDGAPYATDPDYIAKIISIIEGYELWKYDIIEQPGPEPTPEPEPQEEPTPDTEPQEEAQPEPEQYREYTIQWGDCLSVLAQRFGVDENTLADLNGIVDHDLIYAGNTLIIPN